MESNKEYQFVQSIILTLEKQLKGLEQVQHKQEFQAQRREIEEHFERCIHALEVRRQSLLDQLDEVSIQQEEAIEGLKENLHETLQDCQELLSTGSRIYKRNQASAEQIWMEAHNLELPKVDLAPDTAAPTIEVDIPETLLETLAEHGKVIVTNVVLSPIPPITASLKPKSKPKFASTMHFTASGSLRTSTPDKFSEFYRVTTFAGGKKVGFKDGTGKDTRFNFIVGICFSPNDDCFYICDSGNKAIRKLTLQGEVSTYGLLSAVVTGDQQLASMAMYIKENVIYASCGNGIIQILPSGVIDIFAGSIIEKGSANGARLSARFYKPETIAIDQSTGRIFINDSGNCRIAMIEKGTVFTLIGTKTLTTGIYYDEVLQSLLICESKFNVIKAVANGNVSPFCELTNPHGIAITSNRKILVASEHNISLVIADGGRFAVMATAGSGAHKIVDGTARECGFYRPYNMALHEESNSFFVAEYGSSVIRRMTFL